MVLILNTYFRISVKLVLFSFSDSLAFSISDFLIGSLIGAVGCIRFPKSRSLSF